MSNGQFQHESQQMTTDNNRLDRIEKKIDQLSEAMISLARAEEKLMNVEKNSQMLYDRMNRHSEKIDTIEAELHETQANSAVINKIFLACLAACASAIVGFFFTT
jgi:DNA repair ATPase RecN